MAILLDEIGLFPGQEHALQVLAQNEEGMSMGDLSRALHVRPPTASKTITRLAGQGLVERDGASPDGRVVRVKLAEAGREKLKRIDEATEQLESDIAGLFDNKEARRLRKALRRISRHLGEDIVSEGDPLGEDDADTED